MARIRSIHPSFWTSEKIGDLPMGARLLFLGMLTYADDGGRLKESVRALRVQVFPYDTNVTDEDVSSWVSHLKSLELVRSLEAVTIKENRIESVWEIVNFRTHQSPRKPTYSYRSLLDEQTSDAPVPHQYGTSTEPVPTSPMQGGGKGIGIGVGEGVGEKTSLTADAASKRTPKPKPKKFDEFWNTYPRKIGKQAALKSYEKAFAVTGDEDMIIASAADYAQAMKDSELQFIAHPTTWLNQGRWEDVLEDARNRGYNGPRTVADEWGEPCDHGDPLGPQKCALCRRANAASDNYEQAY